MIQAASVKKKKCEEKKLSKSDPWELREKKEREGERRNRTYRELR